MSSQAVERSLLSPDALGPGVPLTLIWITHSDEQAARIGRNLASQRASVPRRLCILELKLQSQNPVPR